MSINVLIKNGGKTFPLELQLNDSVLVFKQKIKELTNIPIERQKILLKSGQLNINDLLVESLNLKKNQIIMVLGSPELNLPQKIDIIETEIKEEKELVPLGLKNLGNTCYLNSSIQILFNIEILKKFLIKYDKFGEIGTNENLVLQLKRIFNELNLKDKNYVTPTNLITSLRVLFPQFNERDNYGQYKQQDAEEVFTQLLLSLNNVLGEEFISNFQIGFKSNIRNLEDITDAEEKYENDLKLQCHIDIKTNFLKNGLENSLIDNLTKFSSNLNKDCEYEIAKKITKLPTILTIQFVRFFWKRATNKKSKILRKVQFPFQLDLTDLLEDGYKLEKIKIRDELRSIEKDKINEITEYNKLNKLTKDQEDFAKSKYDEYLKKYNEIFPDNLANGENPSSLYELNGVLTHQGSSADSGHYQAFIKDKYDDDKWWRFNDDKVSIVDKAKIESLAGGGESDSALILLYKGFGLE